MAKYKCISFEEKRTKKDATVNPDKVYFEGIFSNADDPFDQRDIKVDFFPTNEAREAAYREWADNIAAIPHMNIASYNVELAPHRLRNSNTGAMSENISTSMRVFIRLIANPEWFKGANVPELIPEIDPKRRAEQVVNSIGEWVKESESVSATVEVKAPETVTAAATPTV